MIDQFISGIDLLTTTNVMSNVIDKYEKYKKLRAEEGVYLRMIYLEVLHNLEVFDAIDLETFAGVDAFDEKLLVLLDLLQTEMMEGIFYISPQNEIDLYRTLQTRGKVKKGISPLIGMYFNNQEDKKTILKDNTLSKYENILQAISFVVVKIALLRKVSKLSLEESKMLKNLRIKMRLDNIKQRLLMIKFKLGNTKEVENIAR